MSNALSTVVAIALGSLALAPVIYSMQHPTDPTAKHSSIKLDDKSSNIQKLSYATGYQVGSQVPPDVDLEAFIAGQRDARADKKPIYTEEQLMAAMEAYAKEVAEKEAPPANQANRDAYIKEQKLFLVENAKKEGIKTTESGLQYKIIQEGKGKQATPNATVTVNYEGKTIDGKVFDSTALHGQPATFPLNAVIAGWTEGLSMLKEGGKIELYIPAELAYGERDMPNIPANSTLVFEVELLKVQ